MSEKPSKSLSPQAIVDRSVELIFRTAYAPVDVAELLTSAENRSKIRRLAPSQLFFGLSSLSNEQMQLLLPQVTEEQWTALLDLSLWDRDSADIGRFLDFQRHMVGAPEPVARKLWRATSPGLWELAISRDLQVSRRLDEENFDQDLNEERAIFRSPDNNYLIELPEDSEREAIWESLLPALFKLEHKRLVLLLESALFRTPSELEEEAYRERCERLSDLGFQDYFEAISIYSPVANKAELPAKNPPLESPVATLPDSPMSAPAELLIVQALGQIADRELVRALLEEIFYVSNKLLSADRVPPDDPAAIRETIRKVLAGLNLGLSLLTEDNLVQAMEALRRYFLSSLFQYSYSRLLTVQERARRLLLAGMREDLLEQAKLESWAERYPRPISLEQGRLTPGYFWSQSELEDAQHELDQIESTV